jgi:Na+/proline symporter
MGLGCAALTGDPRFPTYPNALTTAQVESGLSAPATAIALLGKGGAVLMLILLFMAVTSSTSAELIAVSSLLTFDIYKTYFRPNTSSEALVRVSHWGIVLYAIVLAVFCCILNAAGISLTWVLTVLGVIVGGAALPVGMILLWEPMSTVAAVAAPWIGFVCGITVWFVTAYKRSGAINVATTGETTNALAGNLASFGVGFIMAVVLTFVFPGKHADPNAQALAGVAVPVKEGNPTSETGQATAADKAQTPSIDEKTTAPPIPSEAVSPASTTRNELVDYLESHDVEPMDPVLVKRGERIALTANAVFFFGAVILVPFALFGSSYIYSKTFFTGWVVVSFIWIWISVLICVVWPVVESLGALRGISSGLWMDFKSLLGYRKKMGNSETV